MATTSPFSAWTRTRSHHRTRPDSPTVLSRILEGLDFLPVVAQSLEEGAALTTSPGPFSLTVVDVVREGNDNFEALRQSSASGTMIRGRS